MAGAEAEAEDGLDTEAEAEDGRESEAEGVPLTVTNEWGVTTKIATVYTKNDPNRSVTQCGVDTPSEPNSEIPTDYFRDWWKKHVGTSFTFPDTSNNRFQSYCYASAALLLYLEFFQQFLEHLRITKQNGKLNHMESNLVTYRPAT